MTSTVTHAQLVRAAAVWLRREARVVATELVTATSETPDAVGWCTNKTIVVECKTSREDFRRNADKCHERAGNSVGDERWFLVPEDLVQASEVPEGWGLMEYRRSGHAQGYHLRKIVTAPNRGRDIGRLVHERIMLVSVAQRALEAAAQVKPLTLGDGDSFEVSSLEELTLTDLETFVASTPLVEPKVLKVSSQEEIDVLFGKGRFCFERIMASAGAGSQDRKETEADVITKKEND
jgi:hypothetical protein